MITVNSRSYDGRIRRTWTAELIEQNGPEIVMLGVFDRDIHHPDLGHIQKGTLSYEYYWLDRWYNVFRFHESNGQFRAFYCNLNMPPTLVDDVLDYVDLDIDVYVEADSSYRILDREDYERNSKLYGYPAEVHEKVEAALREVVELVERNRLPGAAEVFATSGASERESG